VSPRVFRVVALPAPSERQKTQMFAQRYFEQFPAAGEIVIFDRSWYDRAGVEQSWTSSMSASTGGFRAVPGDREDHRRWRHQAHQDLARGRQGRAGAAFHRAHQRSAAAMETQSDGPRILPALVRLFAGERPDVRDDRHRGCTVYIARSDDKRRARLNCIAHVLSLIPYKKVPRAKVTLPKRSNKHRYDDHAVAER
jgi:polyphosphate kinase